VYTCNVLLELRLSREAFGDKVAHKLGQCLARSGTAIEPRVDGRILSCLLGRDKDDHSLQRDSNRFCKGSGISHGLESEEHVSGACRPSKPFHLIQQVLGRFLVAPMCPRGK
jgi:hypothetical protein